MEGLQHCMMEGGRMEGLQHCMKKVHVHVPYGWFILQSNISRIVGLGRFAGKIS